MTTRGKMDKDRFRRELGPEVEEAEPIRKWRGLGIMPEAGTCEAQGPEIMRAHRAVVTVM